MQVQRSARHRSLGTDCRPQVHAVHAVPTTTTIIQPTEKKRPSLERLKSAPLILGHYQAPTRTNVDRTRIPANIVAESLNLDVINLAVIGGSRVGKTTFIQRALDVTGSARGPDFLSDISFGDQHYRVRVCEINLPEGDFDEDSLLKWPIASDSNQPGLIHGALLLYDVTNDDSVAEIPRMLCALSKSETPITLVACKSEAPVSEQEVGIAFIERIHRSFPSVRFSESSATSIDSVKKSLKTAIQVTLTAISSPTAAFDYLVQESPLLAGGSRALRLDPSHMMESESSTLASMTVAPKSAPALSPTGSKLVETVDTGRKASSSIRHTPRQEVADHVVHQSLVGPRSSGSNQLSEPDDDLTATNDETCDSETPELGLSFSQLVDRLLQMPITKNDSKFVPAFLCLFRNFATPRRLLLAIIDRFMHTDQSDLVSLTKVAELLRYLQVLAQWTANYPEDFAERPTRRFALSFAQGLEQISNFAPAAREIINNLLTIIMDDDHDWAYDDGECYDELDATRASACSFLEDKRDSGAGTESDTSDNDGNTLHYAVRNSGSVSTRSSVMRSSIASSQSANNLFNLDYAREQSKLFSTIPHIPLSKFQWHQFVSIPTEDLAREITRMDWTMYSAVRARDFIRHVSLSSEKRASSRHPDTIGMMVKHFNHLALFVSGMILLRDKAKHRARVLEKLMDLAWKVRQLNNYNSLGAIVAGITGPEISRLGQTWEIVSNDVKKQFLRLTVLMSISRSHAAYRMAWENSFTERIPFVPLIRQDLTMAASANPTFIGKNINWKKFEIMGDVIVSIQRSHEQPYSFPEPTPRSQEIARLILETKIITEPEDCVDPRDELYERSIQLESNTGGDGRKSIGNFGVMRTMTGWFQN